MSAKSRKLGASQFIAALLSFILLTGLGGGILAAMALPFVATTGTAANAVTSIFEDLPTNIDFTQPSEQSVILAADGSHIATFYSENRIVVGSEDISQYIKDAAVAIEDRRFYQHNGIDAQGILGAAFGNITGDSFAGGSTITQQYVKNALIEEGRIQGDDDLIASATERTIARKLNEARYAIAVENQMTKDEILTGYLNIAQFGPSQWGVESASRYFFSVSAADVTLEQAAMLAGITQAPSRWDPVTNPEEALVRRDTVLGAMLEEGYITQEEYDAAVAVTIEEMLNVTPATNGCEDSGISAYFCEYVVKEVLNSPILGETRDDRIQALYRGGLTITTTLDPEKQQAAYDSITAAIPVGDPSGVDTALSSVEPNTGHIVAMVQNTPFGNPTEEQPYATKVNANAGQDMGGGAGFQPGSTFKVFTLVEWLASGRSAYETVNGGNQNFPASAWTISCAPDYVAPASPRNVNNSTYGNITVLQATKDSVNTAYMQMSSRLDLCNIMQRAYDLGVERGEIGTEETVPPLANRGLPAVVGEPLPLEPVPALTLGVNPVTPLSMAVAMATLAAEGNYCEPQSFTTVHDTNGNLLGEQTPNCRQVLDRETARATSSVLKEVPGPLNGAVLAGRPSAGKTGTTDAAYHGWYVGYTPQLAAVVWTGHMEGNIPMMNVTINGRYHRVVYGGTLAGPMFKRYMDAALAGQPVQYFTPPNRSVITPPQVSVPNVTGLSESSATAALNNAGFSVSVGTDYSDQPEGLVARQSPSGTAPAGSTISIWLSIGPDPAEHAGDGDSGQDEEEDG
ncbi:MAG: penicillin-binding protein [Actinomycetaceae bacterium]|nr:penicillin-binding protein [Actinomycetaceae bacterium]